MEPVFPHSLVIGILSLPGIVFFLISMMDIINERRFKKVAIFTEGTVVQSLPAKYKSQMVDYAGGSRETGETEGGSLIIVEFTLENGDVYSAKSKQVFKHIPSTVEVGYNPDDYSDVMIDGYYKSGSAKYFRLMIGLLLGLFPVTWYVWA